jgi:protein-S-isoprenylcysteine O-methyltransferase Ste14
MGNTLKSYASQVMRNKYFDRAVAIIALAPFVYRFQEQLLHFSIDGFSIMDILSLLLMLVFVLTMVFRTPPVRVSTNPFLWVITFFAVYWFFFLPQGFSPENVLVGPKITGALSAIAVCILLLARLSLGRSVGFIPAQRKIVVHGLFKYVRHPIYTAVFIIYLNSALSQFTVARICHTSLGFIFLIVKSLAEEKFLSEDPDYVRYKATVRYRFIPGIV